MTMVARTNASRFSRVLLYAALCGCVGCPPPDRGPPPGPPRTKAQITGTIETNADRLESVLLAKHLSVSAKVSDEKGRPHNYNLEGTLLYKRPRDIRIDLRPGIGDQVMGIGSNDEVFWMWIEPEVGSMRWGHHANVGKPCAASGSSMPFQLASALGLGLPGENEGLKGPSLKRTDQFDVLNYSRVEGEDSISDREYWVDRRAPFMVRKIVFRDTRGKDTVEATLDGYKADYDGAPLAPHKIEVRWLGSNSRLRMEVSSYKAPPEVSPKAFTMPTKEELPDGVNKIIQVDEDCDTE